MDHDDDDDPSDFSIRSGLSRSISSLEDSPQDCVSDPYSALLDLVVGDAMDEESQQLFADDSVPLDETLLPEESQGESWPPLEAPKESGDDDCEIVESSADAGAAAKKVSEHTASQESQHLLALLQMVKDKIDVKKPLVWVFSPTF